MCLWKFSNIFCRCYRYILVHTYGIWSVFNHRNLCISCVFNARMYIFSGVSLLLNVVHGSTFQKMCSLHSHWLQWAVPAPCHLILCLTDTTTHMLTPALAVANTQPVSRAIWGGGSDGRWPLLVSQGSVFLRATGSHYGDEGAEQSGAVLSQWWQASQSGSPSLPA